MEQMRRVWRFSRSKKLPLINPGQPIRLVSIPQGPSAGRRGAPAPSRSLFDRITVPAHRSRSDSPVRHSDVSGPAPSNVDRYVPGRRGGSRSPRPPRRDGRRPGARRERGDRNAGPSRGERLAKDGRPKKTQEELDAEMEDYWGASAKDNGATTEAVAAAPAAAVEDDMMVE